MIKIIIVYNCQLFAMHQEDFFDCSVHVNIELIEPSFLHLHNLFSTVARAADDDDKEVMEEEDGEMEKEGEKGKDDKSKRTECICVF